MIVRAADEANQLAIVRGHQHRRPTGVDLAEQVHDLERQIRIEVARRLVGDHQHRVVHQRARDRNALLLAAGQILRIRVHPVLQADPFEHLKRAAPLLRGGTPSTSGTNEMFSSTVRLGNQLEVLKDESDAAAILLDLAAFSVREVVAIDADLSFGRPLLQQQQPQKRGLAGTARSGEEDELGLLDGEGQIAQRVDRDCKSSRDGASRSRFCRIRGFTSLTRRSRGAPQLRNRMVGRPAGTASPQRLIGRQEFMSRAHASGVARQPSGWPCRSRPS